MFCIFNIRHYNDKYILAMLHNVFRQKYLL